MTDTLKLASALESTLLRPEAREADIVELCHEAVELGVAAVCVNPCWAHRLGTSRARQIITL
ncbi:MAG: hypothetical protein FWG14_06930 [Peptococcaceae bacterium]|nr:hypothetical protein [Peptococcaceae bacterium]